VFTLLTNVSGHSGDRLNSREPHSGIDAVRQQIAGDALPHVHIEPPQSGAALRRSSKIVQSCKNSPVVKDSTELALVDKLFCQGNGRDTPELYQTMLGRRPSPQP